MKRLRTAILGCGNIAHRHASSLASLAGEVELAAFCDRNEERARAFSDKYAGGQAKVYTDHHRLLEEEELDLLAICLPPFGHSDEIELAAERGVHLFVEKPIALEAEQAWRMVAAAERAGIKTQVGFMFRFGEAIEALKGLIGSGEAGPAGLLAARYFCNSLHAYWWRDRRRSGGQLVEQVIHMVDLARYLLGEPVSVYSKQENLFHRSMPDYTVEDASATIIGFRNRAIGVIYATNGAIPGRWINDYRVVTQNIIAEFTNANNGIFHFTSRPDVPPRVIAGERDLHLAEMQELIAAIRTGGETRTPLREGAKSLELALAAALSARSGAEVRLEQMDRI